TAINRRVLALHRAFLAPQVDPGRPWYRNRLVAVDPADGYGAWPLPALRAALARGDVPAANAAALDLARAFDGFRARMESITASLLAP
ncbi:MAG TPA: transferrin receptor-like dimerization domain-containing protein, partial [Planctomycetota bacterium]|nr:transferrin receptor-like dimerization domain-containing protein [Planctomycetota bacterium]